MTARHDSRDPLTPEERALTAMLDAPAGPSPALDARILAAARAAAVQADSLPHAPATSVPAAAIDAERRRRHQRPRGLRWVRVGGVAASLVVVLGLGWRLALEAPMQHEAAAEMATAATEDAAVMVQTVKPPLVAVERASAPVAASPGAEFLPESDTAAQAAVADAPLLEAAPSPRRAAADQTARKATPQSTAAVEAMADMAPAAAPVATPPPPPAPEPPAAARSDDRTRAEERLARPAANAAAASDSAAAAERESLDRIEVTGSRIRIRDVGIGDDARLPIADWFDRIRTRRDAGDLDGARGSLARFRAQHPRVAIPDDLVALDVAPR